MLELADVVNICLRVFAREAREGLGLKVVLVPVFTNFMDSLATSSTTCLKAALTTSAENFPEPEGSRLSI